MASPTNEDAPRSVDGEPTPPQIAALRAEVIRQNRETVDAYEEWADRRHPRLAPALRLPWRCHVYLFAARQLLAVSWWLTRRGAKFLRGEQGK